MPCRTFLAALVFGSVLAAVNVTVKPAAGEPCEALAGYASTKLAGSEPDLAGAVASSIFLNQVGEIDELSDGSLLVADRLGNRVLRIDRSTGDVSPYIGSGQSGDVVDGAQATEVLLDTVQGVVVGNDGVVVVASRVGHSVLAFDPSGSTIELLMGDGGLGVDEVGEPTQRLRLPTGVARAADGTTYVADADLHRVFRIESDGTGTVVAGGNNADIDGDGGRADEAKLSTPLGIALSPDEARLYIVDSLGHAIRAVDLSTGTISTVAGGNGSGFSGDGGQATAAQLNGPFDIDVRADGSLLIADTSNHRVRMVDPAGVISTIAGNGSSGRSGDGGAATAAQTGLARSVTWLGDGGFAIGHNSGARVRVVDSAGVISQLVGQSRSPSASSVPAPDQVLLQPYDTAIAPDGSVYVADRRFQRIVRILPDGGFEVVAGRNSSGGYTGDGGLATDARLRLPRGIAFGPDGTLYIADTNNRRIRAVDPATGLITTVAGNGTNSGVTPGPALDSGIDLPVNVAVLDGKLYISLYNAAQIAAVDLSAGTIEVVVGTGVAGYAGDGGPALDAQLDRPQELEVHDGALLWNSSNNQTVRSYETVTGRVDTVVASSMSVESFAVADDGTVFIGAGQRIWQMTTSTDGVELINTRPVDERRGRGSADGAGSETLLWGTRGLEIDSTGRLIVAAHEGNEVWQFTTSPDSDGDGLTDDQEGTFDHNGNGIPDHLDPDSDGDGVVDGTECVPTFRFDNDYDGIIDRFDPDDDNDGVSRADEPGDTDGDGILDALDLDDDGDFIPSWIEGGTDADGDGTPNMLDLDTDGDGIPDINEGYADGDGDGIRDFLDTDNEGFRLDIASAVLLADGANGLAIGTVDDDGLGFDVKPIGDLDGDGIVDIIVGAQQETGPSGRPGAAYVVFLNSDGTAKSNTRIDPDVLGIPSPQSFGTSIVSLGDLDGDGVPQVAITAMDHSGLKTGTGAVAIVSLASDGTATLDHLITDAEPALGTLGIQAGDALGRSVAVLGDINGDGVDDLAVSLSGADRRGIIDAGAVVVLLMRTDGTVASAAEFDVFDAGDAVSNRESFGDEVAPAGDVDFDGVPDLWVTSRDSNWRGKASEGEIWEVLLAADGSMRSMRRILSTDPVLAGTVVADDGASLGLMVVPDVDGDGIDDWMMGVYAHDTAEADEGGAMLVLRNADGTAKSTHHISRRNEALRSLLSTQGFGGNDLAWLGDLDDDGLPSVAIANNQGSQIGDRRGAVLIVELVASDLDSDGINDVDELPDDTDGDGVVNALDADDDNDGLPTSVESATGDFDRDGVTDALDPDQSRIEVSGIVRDKDGRPLPDATVTLVDSSGELYVTTTGDDGSFTFVSFPSDIIEQGTITLRTAGAEEIELVLGPAAVTAVLQQRAVEQTTPTTSTPSGEVAPPTTAIAATPSAQGSDLAHTGAETTSTMFVGLMLMVLGVFILSLFGGLKRRVSDNEH